ncbi:hypothetical protein [Streptomyces sp. NPDC088801]|uniref:hypothetical protein n=1 Tax=Streptomyces sp. NPDC088801 TaxID=3365903 RepID=UPI00382141B1
MTAHDDDRTPEPADERTEVLDAAGERTRVLGLTDGPIDGPFHGPIESPTGGPTEGLTAVPTEGPTEGLIERPADGSAPSARPGPDDAEYSATVLASHWIQRPGPDETRVERPAADKGPAWPAPPDRVEGSVLRFGPGVTAAARQRTHPPLPAVPPPPAPRHRRLRRHALPALVVVCVLAFLAWQRLGPPLRVTTVTVTARPTALGCDGTADLVGLVTTNGRPGTLSYRWIRSDGTASGVLKEVLVRGQRQARLHLRWTFQGPGNHTAEAELRILSGTARTATTGFAYDCP